MMEHRIGRRRALATFGLAGAGAVLAGCGGDDGERAADSSSSTSPPASLAPAPASGSLAAAFDDAGTCRVTVQQTEGPFYLDVDGLRRDIRDGRDGVPLRVGIRVQDAACAPIRDAVVDLWHCDAAGEYSGFGGAPEESRFLRGAQATDGDGIAELVTVYPGWYPGRTVHIHAKVHVSNTDVLTTQLYFDGSVSDAVYEREPYASDDGRRTTNDDDGFFDEGTMLTLFEDGDGYLGLITLVVEEA